MAVQPFTKPEDVANRALQHCGARRILSLADNSKQAQEVNFCYDKLRVAELRRSTWRFATRRANLRALSSTSRRFIPASYAAATTYAAGAIVMDATGVYWQSNVGGNVGNTPGTAVVGYPAYWTQYFGPIVCDVYSASTTYDAGEIVYTAASPNVYYVCTANGSLNQAPASGAPWVPIGAVTADQAITLLQPSGPGKTVSTRARNMFPLPNGYLRPLYPDPKVESNSVLTTSAALQFQDLQFEGNYIISSAPTTAPLLLRFVADVSDVAAMDALFCEGLAARVGYEICEPLTQSNVKLQAIGAAYQKFMQDARLINWLETGSTEPQEAEYELTRGPQGVTEGVPATAMPGEQRGQGGSGIEA